MNWNSRQLLTVLLVLGLVLGAVACSTPPPATEPTEPPAETEGEAEPAEPEPTDAPATEEEAVLKVGLLSPFSAHTARYGEEILKGVEMALDEADYKVGPYTIELIPIDSQADPAKAAEAYEQAIVETGIDVGLLNWHSSISVACMDISAKHKMPHFFGFGATDVVNEKYESDPESYSYWMGKTWPSTIKLASAYVETLEAAIDAGIYPEDRKTLFITGEDTDWGRSYGTGFRTHFEAAGWEVVGEDYYPAGSTEYFAFLERARDLSPGVIAQASGGPDVVSAFVKQADQLGLTEETLLILDGFGWMSEWYELTGESSNYVLDQIPEMGSEEAQAWAQRFEERYDLEPSPSSGGQAYDMAKFFLKIAERTLEKHGEITSETLYEVGQSELWTGELVYEGIIHEKYQYTPESIPDPVVGEGYFIFPVRQYISGERTIIWPDSMKTAELQVPEGLE